MARQTTRIITPAGGEGGVGPGVLYSFKQRRPEVRKTHAPPVAKLCKRAGRRHAQLRTALVTKVTTGLLPPSRPTAGGPHRRGRQCNAASLIRPQPGGATPPPGGRRTDGGRGWAGGFAPSRPTVRWSGCRRAWQEPHTGVTATLTTHNQACLIAGKCTHRHLWARIVFLTDKCAQIFLNIKAMIPCCQPCTHFNLPQPVLVSSNVRYQSHTSSSASSGSHENTLSVLQGCLTHPLSSLPASPQQ